MLSVNGADQVIKTLLANGTVEISVGAAVLLARRDGYANGKPYQYVWLQASSDHLAIGLNGDRGACNNEMGCGAGNIKINRNGNRNRNRQGETSMSAFTEDDRPILVKYIRSCREVSDQLTDADLAQCHVRVLEKLMDIAIATNRRNGEQGDGRPECLTVVSTAAESKRTEITRIITACDFLKDYFQESDLSLLSGDDLQELGNLAWHHTKSANASGGYIGAVNGYSIAILRGKVEAARAGKR